MRIISGKYKGRRILAPKKLPTRPTTDQAKEGLFNILWNRYDFGTLSVLDLFAGIGSISFEFASRGVPNITAVDQDYGCVKFIRKTAEELEAGIFTVKNNVFSFLQKPSGGYDLIFADPPYKFTEAQFAEIINMVFAQKYLTEKGVLIVEHSKHTQLSTHPQFRESRRYGGSVFSFFEY